MARVSRVPGLAGEVDGQLRGHRLAQDDGAGLPEQRHHGGVFDWPPAADLTARATYATYDSVDKFKAMFRSGKRPTGEAIRVMPFPSLGAMNDTDVDALYAYLKTLPDRASPR